MADRLCALRLRCGAAVVGAAVLAAGCGSADHGPPPSSSSGSPTAQLEIGNTLSYASVGTTADLDCADGKSLNVGGSNNTLTVHGTCASVTVGGTDNKVTVDRIDGDLSVVGFNNTVSYKQGEPHVTDLGSNNTINKS